MFMDHFWMGRYFYGHSFYALTMFTYMRDWCKQHFSDEDKGPNFYDNCAVTHLNNGIVGMVVYPYGANPEIMPQNYYFDLQHPKWTTHLQTGFLLSIPQAFKLNERYGIGRYGIDYIAYLQQANAVLNGETDYA
jgi:hypothetical protein